MKQEELNKVLELHKKWLNNEEDGVRANLNGADLRNADLSVARLRGADLSCADLRNADLRGADLSDVKHDECTAFYTLQCPEEGSFIAFKKLRNGLIAKLMITEDALRSSATSLKCRASKAKVLAIYDEEGNNVEQGFSKQDVSFIYKVGTIVEPTKPFDTDRWNECASGIHFFMSRAVAEQY